MWPSPPMPVKILIVDDEPAIVDMLAYNLQRANYQVPIARDGEGALDKARQEQPDLIILDLMLPRWSLLKTDPGGVCRPPDCPMLWAAPDA